MGTMGHSVREHIESQMLSCSQPAVEHVHRFCSPQGMLDDGPLCAGSKRLMLGKMKGAFRACHSEPQRTMSACLVLEAETPLTCTYQHHTFTQGFLCSPHPFSISTYSILFESDVPPGISGLPSTRGPPPTSGLLGLFNAQLSAH